MWNATISKVANGYVVQCTVARQLVDRAGNLIEGRVMVAQTMDEAAEHATNFGEEVEAGRPVQAPYNEPAGQQARPN